MAIGEPYVTTTALKSYLKITDAVDDAELDVALFSASRAVEDFCNRQFNDAGAVSPRVYTPEHYQWVIVDDFSSTVGLDIKIDEGGDGVFETTWGPADYQVAPANGVIRGQAGFPFWEIRTTLTTSRYIPTWTRRPSIQVTAQWGWATIPDPVKQACLILAAEQFKLKDAPFGVAGFSEFGAVRVRNNPMVASMLQPYARDGWLVVRT
jgi:hypothetical protein